MRNTYPPWTIDKLEKRKMISSLEEGLRLLSLQKEQVSKKKA